MIIWLGGYAKGSIQLIISKEFHTMQSTNTQKSPLIRWRWFTKHKIHIQYYCLALIIWMVWVNWNRWKSSKPSLIYLSNPNWIPSRLMKCGWWSWVASADDEKSQVSHCIIEILNSLWAFSQLLLSDDYITFAVLCECWCWWCYGMYYAV